MNPVEFCVRFLIKQEKLLHFIGIEDIMLTLFAYMVIAQIERHLFTCVSHNYANRVWRTSPK